MESRSVGAIVGSFAQLPTMDAGSARREGKRWRTAPPGRSRSARPYRARSRRRRYAPAGDRPRSRRRRLRSSRRSYARRAEGRREPPRPAEDRAAALEHRAQVEHHLVRLRLDPLGVTLVDRRMGFSNAMFPRSVTGAPGLCRISWVRGLRRAAERSPGSGRLAATAESGFGCGRTLLIRARTDASTCAKSSQALRPRRLAAIGQLADMAAPATEVAPGPASPGACGSSRSRTPLGWRR